MGGGGCGFYGDGKWWVMKVDIRSDKEREREREREGENERKGREKSIKK